ncbi:MAG TPA: FtsX-like permease family protein [Lentimicrobium sp.]|nr:FtsX-like permease family protein [Lentimicrobium sp.]
MLINYFKSAVRNFIRYKVYALVNIASLTIGITGCLMIGLFVQDELSYDKKIPGGENIYRIYEQRKQISNTIYSVPVPPMYGTFLKSEYPEVESVGRILMYSDEFLLENGSIRNYEPKGVFADTSLLDIFSFKFIEGSAKNALKEVDRVVLTKKIARKYFGDSGALGKIIVIDKSNFTIDGVIDELPDHFHLDFSYLMSLSSLRLPPERMKAWTWHQLYTYVKFRPSADVKKVEENFRSYIKKEVLPMDKAVGSEFLPLFQRLSDIHLKSADFTYDNAIRGNLTYVKTLSIIALFVLVIACFNFINLSTARSFKRSREIGVRKVVGAHRNQLIHQFISETLVLSVIAVIIGIVLTILFLPALNNFTGKSISFDPLSNPLQGLVILVAGGIIGIIAGIYPAFVLSSFRPVNVLKGARVTDKGLSSAWLRRSLVVLQFALSVLLIISTLVVSRQTIFFVNNDLGFDKDHVITFQARGELEEKIETFKSEIRQLPGVISVTSGYGLPGDAYAGETVTIPGEDGNVEYPTNNFIGDYDYIKTLGMKIVAGRDFQREMGTDEREAFIINETAVRHFGFKTPQQSLGRSIYWNEWLPLDSLNPVKKGRVIGVVEDFHYKSLHEKVTASLIQIYPQVTYKVAAKLKEGNIQETLKQINDLWYQYSPGYPFIYDFMEDSFGLMYKNEQKLSYLLWIFSITALMIGCMGLFALTALNAEERTKEIGIRKILGAGVLQVISLLARNFLKLILISAVIAMPVAWFAMDRWLHNFPYRISISWWVFILAIIIVVVIALLTIILQTARVAMMKPVEAIRTE